MKYDYPTWYKDASVKFKIIGYTFNREVSIIKPNYLKQEEYRTTRNFRMHNVQSIDAIFNSMHIFDGIRLYNIYVSLAQYRDGIPKSSLNLSSRDFDDWKKNHWKQMISWDFLLDIDCKSLKEVDFAYYAAKNIHKFFNKLNVPHYIIYSGMGFHVKIPYRYFKDLKLSFNKFDDNRVYRLCSDIAVKLYDKFSNDIDVTIYDPRRVVKIPYTLAIYDGEIMMCRPFQSNDDFDNFKIEDMRPENNINNIRYMTDYLFNPEGNIYKLLKELNIKWN